MQACNEDNLAHMPIGIGCPSCCLKTLCLARHFDQGQLHAFASLVKHRTPLQRGQHLFRQGGDVDAFWLVKAGTMKTYLTAEDGTDQVTGFPLAGELVGLEGLYGDARGCSGVALEDTFVCEIPAVAFERLMSTSRAFAGEVLRELCAQLTKSHNLRLLCQRKVDTRLACFLVDLADRFAARGFSAERLRLTMSRSDIANHLGTAPETVSRTFTRFEQQGLVHVYRREVTIRAPERLRALSVSDAVFDRARVQHNTTGVAGHGIVPAARSTSRPAARAKPALVNA